MSSWWPMRNLSASAQRLDQPRQLHLSVELAQEAVKLGALNYLPKPFERDTVLLAVRGVLAME